MEWKVTTHAIDRALAHISGRTAMGPDGLPASVVKSLGEEAKEQLAGLLTEIIKGAPIPQDWCQGRVTFIPKKGGQAELIEDYHPLTVTSVLYRLFARILKA